MSKYLGYQGDGREVFFRNKKYFIWRNTINNSFVLCERIEDVCIKGVLRLRNDELQEVIDIVNYRDGKLKQILD